MNHIKIRRKNWKFRLGLILIIGSIPFFLFLLFIPFFDIENKEKIALSTTILIIAEIMFWGGGFLLGKELFKKYKSYFNPKKWFKKK